MQNFKEKQKMSAQGELMNKNIVIVLKCLRCNEYSTSKLKDIKAFRQKHNHQARSYNAIPICSEFESDE